MFLRSSTIWLPTDVGSMCSVCSHESPMAAEKTNFQLVIIDEITVWVRLLVISSGMESPLFRRLIRVRREGSVHGQQDGFLFYTAVSRSFCQSRLTWNAESKTTFCSVQIEASLKDITEIYEQGQARQRFESQSESPWQSPPHVLESLSNITESNVHLMVLKLQGQFTSVWRTLPGLKKMTYFGTCAI